MSNVLDDRVHCFYEKNLILVIHGHDNEKFRLTTHEVRAESVLGRGKVIGIARDGGVSHVGLLLGGTAVGNDRSRNGHVEHEVALLELDMADGLQRN